MQELLYPVRIVSQAGVDGVENLFRRQALQVDLRENYLTCFHSGSHIILDFGQEMRGGVRLIVSGSDLTKVHIRFGESVGECCAELGAGEQYSGKTQARPISEKALRQNATNDHALRDLQVALPNWSDQTIGDTGFRFVRLDFEGEYAIKSILCTNTILNRPALYIYRGEAKVEQIFAAAKRTIDLCAGSGYLWDGIKRDRLVWAGDMGPEVLAMATLYGQTPEVENSLDFVREYSPLPGWMNSMPNYSMWWILMLRDYLQITGAEDFVKKQMDYLQALVRQMAQSVDESGQMHYPSYFLDWPHAGTEDEEQGARAINMMATQAAVELLEHFGLDAAPARAHLQRLRLVPICPRGKVVTALKYLATGSLSPREQEILLTGGAEGMSTFMSYYVLKAVHAFAPETAKAMLLEYYGGMLSLGATTFWEDFELEQRKGTPIDEPEQEGIPDCHGDFGRHCYIGFRRSLCHGWSAGVIAYIKECL